MRVLRLGMSGAEVGTLQALLRFYDPTVTADNNFGPKTERAVRTAQRRLGLFPPDGVAGPQTLSALAKAAKARTASQASWWDEVKQMAGGLAARGSAAMDAIEREVSSWFNTSPAPAAVPPRMRRSIEPARQRATTAAVPPGEVRSPKSMRLSLPGRQFIFRHEAGDGSRTGRVHWPEGASGVTIGAGYDMRMRSKASIVADMVAVRVDPATAARIAEASGLAGSEAKNWAKANRDLVNLTFAQQVALQNHDKGSFENMVRTRITRPLHQYEFDALVSFAGNPGKGGWPKVVNFVNANKNQSAVNVMHEQIGKDPATQPGLLNRRHDEGRLLMYGEYR